MRKYASSSLALLAVLSFQPLNAFINNPPKSVPCDARNRSFCLSAKRKVKRKKKKKNAVEISLLGSRPSLESLDATKNTATQRPPAKLAGVVEDHRFEQFFYDEGTADQLYQLVDRYEHPLLMCNPTLAVLAEQENRPYRLLDRDTRFNFLSGYREFNLAEPYSILDYDFDAVFIDPPFANVTPDQIARCLRLMAADRVPLYVAYNSRREGALLNAMNALDCPDLERKWSLNYKEGVSDETQHSIWLYGPESDL